MSSETEGKQKQEKQQLPQNHTCHCHCAHGCCSSCSAVLISAKICSLRKRKRIFVHSHVNTETADEVKMLSLVDSIIAKETEVFAKRRSRTS